MISQPNNPSLSDVARLKMIHALGLFDTSAVESLDRLTQLASKMSGSPIALISIVAEERQFFKSAVGLPEPLDLSLETSLDYSFCQHVVATQEPLIAEDVRTVPLLRENLSIRDFGIVSYLGLPLIVEGGICVGTFCVMDQRPRQWTPEQVEILQELAIFATRDIELSAQVRAQRLAEVRLEQVVKHVPVIVYALDRDGRFVLSEGRGLISLGREPGQVVGTSIFELYADYPEVLHALDRAYQGESVRIPVTMAGSIYDVWYEAVYDDDGDEVISVVGLAHDMTQAKQIERDLEQRLFELATLNDITATLSTHTDLMLMLEALTVKIHYLFHGVVTAIALFDYNQLEGRFVTAYDPDSAVGSHPLVDQTFSIRVSPHSPFYTVMEKRPFVVTDVSTLPVPYKIFELIRAQEIGAVLILPLLSHARVIGTIAVTLPETTAPLTAHDLHLAKSVATQVSSSIYTAELFATVQTELAERKRAEAELTVRLGYEAMLSKCAQTLLTSGEAQENLVQTLNDLLEGTHLDRVFIGKSICSADGQFSHIEWNYESVTSGLLPIPESFLAQPYYLPHEWIDRIQTQSGMFIEGGPHLGEYHTYFSATGNSYSCYMVPIGLDQNWYGLLGLVKDDGPVFWTDMLVKTVQMVAKMIHTFLQRQQAYFDLEQTHQEAVAANRIKNQVLAKVSHEFKTPLGSILGFSELLSDEAYGTMTAQQQTVVKKIMSTTGYLNTLVNELLDQSRLDSGQIALEVYPFRLSYLLEEIEQQTSVLASNKNITLRFQFEATLFDVIHNDRHRLQQVILNLVGNGVKFTDEGEVLVVAEKLGDDHWELVVEDSGIGIPTEAQPYIFEPFWQVKDATSKHVAGSGLGLSIASQLVTLMGGELTLSSVLGEGSVFRVKLPLVVSSA